MFEQLFFYIFAFVAFVTALCVVSVRNPVHSAFFLIICMIQVAALFILLRSPFLAAVQVFIYVGAVMVLFLFAIMVLDIGKERLRAELHHQNPLAVATVVALLVFVGFLIFRGETISPKGPYDEAALAQNTEVIGKLLYTKYLFPFEVVSLLLLVALIGAVVLVMKEKDRKKGRVN